MNVCPLWATQLKYGVLSWWPFLLLWPFYLQVSRYFQACWLIFLHFWYCVLFHIIESKIEVDFFFLFNLYRCFRDLRMQLLFKWTIGTRRDKNLPSTSKNLVDKSIIRHCTLNHAAYLIKWDWTGILANMQSAFLKLKT